MDAFKDWHHLLERVQHEIIMYSITRMASTSKPLVL